MNLFGLTISRSKAVPLTTAVGQLSAIRDRGWWRVLESSAGAWQRNEEITVANVTTHPAIFACTTLIANDIGKMRLRLVQETSPGVWDEISNPAFSPVLRRPNHFQNRIQFTTNWIISKLLHGNTYVLKVRDARRVVVALYVLDAQRVQALQAPNGDVFYNLKRDDLAQLPREEYTVPASEIIHDRWNDLFHPLVGLSPIYAGGLAAVQGLNIQDNSTNFFGNGSRPGGVLTAPGNIADATATRLKEYFDANFSGENAGKVAVLGDGLKYEQMTMSATDAQLIEQLKWSAETICSVFHVPAYMAGFGPAPGYSSVEALNQQYYSQCLQVLIESVEECLDWGLGLKEGDVAAEKYGTEFDLSDLLRMDTATRVKAAADSLGAGMTHNEVRRTYHGLGPVKGGDAVLSQQQNFSLEALAERDQNKPFAKPAPAPVPTPQIATDDDVEVDDDTTKALASAYAGAAWRRQKAVAA